jgi:hypothetical protein
VTLAGLTLERDWSETVACLPDRPGALPARDEQVVGDYTVTFEARVERPADFAASVSAVIAECAADPLALVAEFPGSPLAVTALSAGTSGAGVTWQTWHAYPQVGELVWTSSVVSPR